MFFPLLAMAIKLNIDVRDSGCEQILPGLPFFFPLFSVFMADNDIEMKLQVEINLQVLSGGI